MNDELTAGAPVVIPGRVAGVGVIHLGRTEARRRAGPAILGMCDAAVGLPLERAPRTRWWRRPKWCPDCAEFRDYLRGLGQL